MDIIYIGHSVLSNLWQKLRKATQENVTKFNDIDHWFV